MAGHYVYIHRRADNGQVFYVGKGSGHRARVEQNRNRYWCNVVAKSGGYSAQIAADGMDEELSLLAEVELINKLRALGVKLTNLTDGGEGMSGYKVPPEVIARRVEKTKGVKRPNISASLKGVPKSLEHRRNLSSARIGRTASEATRKLMSTSRRGKPSHMRGKHHSEETKKKISIAVSGDRAPFKGRKHSDESLKRMSDAHRGVKLSEETRAKMSASRTGDLNPSFGRVISEEQKLRQIASLKARPLLTCPYCSKATNEGNARRWHFDNCTRKD